jgi:hypothetical protein
VTDGFRRAERIVHRVEPVQLFQIETAGYSWPVGAGFKYFAKAVDSARSFYAAAAMVSIAPPSTLATLQWKVYKRPQDVAEQQRPRCRSL